MRLESKTRGLEPSYLSWVWSETHSFSLTKALLLRALSLRFQIFFVHHFSDFTCFLLTNNLHITPAGHGLSCSPHFWRHETKSINPTLRHTTHFPSSSDAPWLSILHNFTPKHCHFIPFIRPDASPSQPVHLGSPPITNSV